MSELRRRPLRRLHQEDVGLQIAPMIDVTMLLLFFFMLTGKLTQGQKLRSIDLPRAQSAVIPDDFSGRDVINVDGAGNVFVSDEPMDNPKLKTYLKQRFKDYPPLKLHVRADAKTPAKKIKEIMALAAEAGAVEVIYGAYQR